MRHLIGTLLLLGCFTAQAQVYKWVDENGVVHYTDKPPSSSAKPAKLPALQTFKGDVPALDRFEKPADPAASKATKLRITSPATDETFRNESEGQISVSVVVTPALLPDQDLVYFVNGVQQGDPTRNSSQTLQVQERGEHRLSVAIMQGKKEIFRDSVTVHVKPATVKR